MIRSKKGFSIVEVIVACAIIGIAAKLVMTFSSSVNFSQEVVTRQVSLTKIINRVWGNILRDNNIIPPFDPSYGSYGGPNVFYYAEGGNLKVNKDVLESYFNETEVEKRIYGIRCYGKYGSEVLPEISKDDDSLELYDYDTRRNGQNNCFYRVKFLKVRVPDKNFFTSANCSDINLRTCSLSRIPMSYYYAQVEYYYNKRHAKDKKSTKFLISSLKTDVFEF